MTPAERADGAGTTGPADPADAVAAAVLAVDGVVSLHGGAFGEVATLLPGRRVAGVRLADPATDGDGRPSEVHVVASAEVPVTETAAAVHAAVTPLVSGPVHVVVEDVMTAAELAEQREREERERLERERAEAEKAERAERREAERAEAEREQAEADRERAARRAEDDAEQARREQQDEQDASAGQDGERSGRTVPAAAPGDGTPAVVVVAETAEVTTSADGQDASVHVTEHDQQPPRDGS